MHRNFKRILWLAVVVIIMVPVLGLVLAHVTDYRPEANTPIEVLGPEKEARSVPDTFSLVSWNLGYGGLGREMDFFYDGGKQVRPDKIVYQRYIRGILKELNEMAGADFLLIQELDLGSKRSYHDNQRKRVQQILPDHYSAMAINYHVRFVPMPPASPMGKVRSGIALLSRARPISSQRHALESDYSWPKQLFMPDRCFILNRYPLDGARELVVINTHNSAFDDGTLREAQMEQLREIMVGEYEKGNYVIAGGDWNQNPPGFRKYEVFTGDLVFEIKPGMREDLFPDGWFFVYDRSVPTNRFLLESYLKSRTPTTIIDFFIISPNLMYLESETIDLGFENSDHNPVRIKVRLLELD